MELVNNFALTKGNPKPALAQLTPASFSLSTSATGDTRFEGGKTGDAQEGHWYPAGAVVRGNARYRDSAHSQWNTSKRLTFLSSMR